MIPTVQIASAATPDGGELVLYKHDQDFVIKVNYQDLMTSRQHESELELARLGCGHLAKEATPKVLIAGMGMGYTMRQTLDIVGEQAEVVVAELLEAVVDWNREHLGVLNGHPIDDPRVKVEVRDALKLMRKSKEAYDAILLDVDNGPSAMTTADNWRLYDYSGVRACRQALKPGGMLAIWSAEPSKRYEAILMESGFQVRRYRVPAYKGSRNRFHFIWLATTNRKLFPPGGGVPGERAKSKKQR